jgi:hypothetical protein
MHDAIRCYGHLRITEVFDQEAKQKIPTTRPGSKQEQQVSRGGDLGMMVICRCL